MTDNLEQLKLYLNSPEISRMTTKQTGLLKTD